MKKNKSDISKSSAGLRRIIGAGFMSLMSGLAADSYAKKSTPVNEPVDACGYALSSGTQAMSRKGYHGWVAVNNVSGETAKDFEVLLRLGESTISNGQLAQYEQVQDGYLVSAPSWLQHKTIRPGSSHHFQFKAGPEYQGISAYLLSINGIPCDLEPPEVALSASEKFLNGNGTLTLTANATDNAAVRYVTFEQNGEVVGEDWQAPFELEIDVTEQLNGFHAYTATAYDPSGNQAESGRERVLVAINNKFFGTAPGGPEDFEHLLTYFNQLTPENSGKWGSVERERDVMNWQVLDEAYYFARQNNIPFKFHTLVWGQQQPAWLADLSPEEQLAELDEWMGLVAERYPDLEMVEVVNEPLHAPAGYAEALGGDGATGWDWVITAFEMAREHFPQAQLLLNDYQILHLPAFTQDYLEIITVLHERELIDGIGLQSHFLERADVAVVAQNLDTLAATGLPIYISEFDLNYADDARHANVFRDLFTVFWDHPSVVGVTHWGHLQGSVWREDGYLVRSDDSTRPAMDWVQCYIAGGNSCFVPEYIPTGWQGDEFGLTLQAEEYDAGEGVLTLGDVASYTDAGDWIAYRDVEFQAGWDTFWVTYMKGNQDVGSISIFLDSMDSAPVLTVELPNSGGWGSASTLELPWPEIAGTHDVYIRFNDVYGVANLDSVRFGKPQVISGPNLVTDGGFEGSSITGWHAWNGSTLALSTNYAFSGSQSLYITDRPNTAQYAVYNLTDVVTPGTTYAVSAQVLLDRAAPDTARLAAKVECANPPEGHNTYPWLHNLQNVAPGEWTELSANLTIPDCDIVDVSIFFEGTSAGVDVYLDDVTVTPPTQQNLLADGGFENGIAGWSSWNGAVLSASTDAAYSGSQSLRATDRPNTNQFAVYNLTGLVSPGTTYSVSAQALITGTDTDTVRLAAKVECSNPPEGHNTYPWLHNRAGVVPGEWTEISAELVIPDCNVVDVAIFFEGTSPGKDVYLDEVTVLAQ
jgi:endo-1,4-beta-xylanase